MHIPSSTYRIQFHKGFTFRDLQRILDYLHTLGISTLYASPIMQATPGSMHGYDVTDPHIINEELGKADELRAIVKELHKKDMHWLQDIVPNHMAFHTQNFRLMDVLERGPASSYYRYFDIDWDHPDPDIHGKLMVPFLGGPFEECLSRGEIKLVFKPEGFFLQYFDTGYPLSVPAYASVVSKLAPEEGDHLLAGILTKMIAAAEGATRETWHANKNEFLLAIHQSPDQVEAIEKIVQQINANTAEFNALADQQYYRLCFWKETDTRINYRRFFTINELICLRMEDDAVFEEYHAYLLQLYKDKLIDGFRIDHIDGLKDPATYVRNLRQQMGEGCYIIAEKILEAKEDMPADWPLQGTSGYEFLSFLNQLLTNRKGARELLAYYKELVPDMPPFRRLIFASKKLILENYISGEWSNLVRLLKTSGLGSHFEQGRIKEALGYFMLSLPVYRIYPERVPLRGTSLVIVHEAFDKALAEAPTYADELYYLRALLTMPPKDETTQAHILDFVKRLMQFTGPLTAKGVEDTTFYIYNPLISHDEVGDSPAPLGMTVQKFHEKMKMRRISTPLSLNATATHDTKRGEDSRVRINVLSRIPEVWKESVTRWLKLNAPLRTAANGKTIPEINDEYFIYQSMLGGFPEDFAITEEWKERVKAYLIKALREAKVNTNWSSPEQEYERGCEQFIERILDPGHGFLASFVPFVKTVCEHAMVYSLTQTLVKLTAPGIPDIYQGCELWDLSFVDPDNRRPVDYDKRMEFLFQLVVREEKGMDAVFEYLRQHREEGIEKLFITWRTLGLRRSNPSLFAEGDYIPVSITGSDVTAAAYARNIDSQWVIIAFPFGLVRREAGLSETGNSEQFLIVPERAPEQWVNVFTGEIFETANQISVQVLFRNFPVALLMGDASYRVKNASASEEAAALF